MDKPKIGITIGDLNGIGMEIILKTLGEPKILNFCLPVIYGSTKVVSYHKNIVGIEFPFQSLQRSDRFVSDRVNIVNCWQENVNITLGKATDVGGKYAMLSLEAAVQDLKEGIIDGLVTAPINKEAMQMAGFRFPGHTEYLNHAFGVKDSLMFMVSENLRVGLATNHLPISGVAGAIQKDVLVRKIKLMHDTLRIDFGVDRPTIAVLALNPHGGDGGLIGKEDETMVRPAIVESKKSGIIVVGPFPADGFFGSGAYKKFDGILAMYHDQGLVPFKFAAFGGGINFTAGLPGVRTSPDHGTAYDIAGKNEADPTSFREALFAAIDIARNRKEFHDDRANALVKRGKSRFVAEEDDIDDLDDFEEDEFEDEEEDNENE
jgi:4-hydroxythreonine-4-phosphate dehydrogenase